MWLTEWGACCQSGCPEFDPWNPDSGRNITSGLYVCHLPAPPRIHTKQIDTFFIKIQKALIKPKRTTYNYSNLFLLIKCVCLSL